MDTWEKVPYLSKLKSIKSILNGHGHWVCSLFRAMNLSSIPDVCLPYRYGIRYHYHTCLKHLERWAWFYSTKVCLLSHISEISTAISRINEPIPGMFVLIWMHFSLWIQIWSWNATISTFFTNCVYFLTCRLHSPAAWKALTLCL